MYKSYHVILILSLVSVNTMAQSLSIDHILKDIEQNNKALKAYASYIDHKQLLNKSNNNLNNPEFSFYYLPWGNTPDGDYNEVQLAQKFNFPTVYTNRNAVNKEKQTQYQHIYKSKRQDILFEAKNICLDIVYLNKQIKAETERFNQALTLYNQLSALYHEKEIGILDFNKSKINKLKSQHALEELKVEQQNAWLRLQQLNNQQPLDVKSLKAENSFTIPSLQALWDAKKNFSPKLASLESNVKVARKNIGLQKATGMPQVSLGFNRQAIPGSTHLGIYSGITIPLWENKHKVESAKLLLKYEEESSKAKANRLYSEVEQSYNAYLKLLAKYKAFKTILNSTESESLLMESYKLGEISFTTYYIEIQFYRDAQNEYLRLENQLLKAKNALLKHQL